MPTIHDWCLSAQARLPRERTNGDFSTYLRDLFAEFDDSISRLGDGHLERLVVESVGDSKNLSKKVAQAVGEYLAGHPNRAYQALEAGISPVRRHLNALQATPQIAKLLPFYRMRLSSSTRRWAPQDLFHVPFQSRGLVSAQRYSIHGLPCLYLGNSAYVCWEELHRPPFDNVYLMQLRLRESVRIQLLDIAFIPQFLSGLHCLWQKNGPNKAQLEAIIVANVVLWPLVAACSIRALEPLAVFKPEYIVPQLLTQWVTQETSWHGIRYFSTKVGAPSTLQLGANLVFPVRTSPSEGICAQLRGLFECTPVWSWQVALAASQVHISSEVNGQLELAPGARVEHRSTQFWQMESMLNAQDRSPLQ